MNKDSLDEVAFTSYPDIIEMTSSESRGYYACEINELKINHYNDETI